MRSAKTGATRPARKEEYANLAATAGCAAAQRTGPADRAGCVGFEADQIEREPRFLGAEEAPEVRLDALNQQLPDDTRARHRRIRQRLFPTVVTIAKSFVIEAELSQQ